MGNVSVANLREQLRGQVITPDDAGYEDARKVYNAMIDRRPAAVVRPANAGDVIAAVNFARENDLDLAVRGGAHSVPGFGTVDDGVAIDMSGMRGVRVDPTRQRARAEGGATWGDFNVATYPFGLATTGGIVSTTGVSGLTLGGGIGYLARGFGLSCDNLVSADVVTADGRFLVASEQEHQDLFWALRGGGGNFGVVTSLEFQLHPVKDIYGGPMFFELDDAEAVLRFYREFIADAPEQFGGFPAWQIAPPLPFIPEDRHGDPFLAFVACWAGPLDQGEAALKPLHDVAPVVAEHVGPMPYPALNAAFDGLVPLNGACHRVGADETAFAYRDATFATVIAGMWPDPAQNEANIAWVRDYYDATAPHSEQGGYVNFMSGDDQDRIKVNYRGNYERLVQVKRRYDPGNLFHVNQNIAP
jgi:hypothetical protein